MANIKEINSFPGYFVSDNGNVFTTRKMGRSEPYQTPKRLMKPPVLYGYYRVNLKKDRHNYNFRVSRLVAQHFIPNPENKPYVCHKDGNKLNNNVENLYWGTAQENSNDRIKHGNHLRVPRGDCHYRAKLTNKDVEEIKYLRKTFLLTQSKIGEIFGIHQSHISDILNGKKRKLMNYE